MPKWSAGDTAADPESAIDHLLQAAARAGLTSQRAGNLLDQFGVAETVVEYVPDPLIRSGSEQVDFAASTAFVRSRVEWGVRINLVGREPDGVVPPEEYDRVRADLIDLLSAVEAPDGTPAFERVRLREEVFDGPHVEEAADVIFVPNEMAFYPTVWLTGEQFETPDGPTWDHTLGGVIAASGRAIDATTGIGSPHVRDVAPTVLSTLGLAPPERMDGTALPVASPPASADLDGGATEPTRMGVSDR